MKEENRRFMGLKFKVALIMLSVGLTLAIVDWMLPRSSADFSTIAVILILLAVMVFLVHRMVLEPLSHMAAHMLSIKLSGGLTDKISMERNDELGMLAHSFNDMLDQLQTQNRDLELLGSELLTDLTHLQQVEVKLLTEIDENKRLLKEREELQEEINRKETLLGNMAVTDNLTGLFNHKYIIERLSKELEEARRYENPFSLLMFEIDNFDWVTENFGGQVAEEVMTSVAGMLRETMRTVDLLGRFGGEVFILLLPGTPLEGASIAGERLLKKISGMGFRYEGLTITISIGAVAYTDETTTQLIEQAENMFNKAKDNGGNCLVGGHRGAMPPSHFGGGGDAHDGE